MKKFLLFLPAALFILLSSAFAQLKNTETETFNSLKSNLRFLSDDVLEGRNSPSAGEKTAALFISAELMKYNVKPFGDNGSWFNNFDVKSRKFTINPEFILKDKKGNQVSKLNPGPDFTIDNSKIFSGEYLNKNAGIVFAGYGITAPEFQYDDYANLNARGKIVMILAGEPENNDPEFFSGKEYTSYSSGKYKFEKAKEEGAIGVFIILPDEYYDVWYVFHSMMMTGALILPQDEFTAPGGLPYAMLTLQGAAKILNAEKLTYDDLLAIRNGSKKPESILLNKYTSFNLETEESNKTLQNVVGIIEGNDPEFRNEYIVISAHYDHVGIYDGDVCNGANDNGSGVVAVLELAKRFAASKQNRRPIIVAFFSAEEKGLLGSEAFATSLFEKGKIVANINIDMCGRGDNNEIFAIGADRTSSELADIINLCNAETVNMNIDVSLSNSAYFELSDHYSFAKKKIPAVFFFDNYRDGLHGPDDEFEHIDFEKILKIILLTEQIAHHLSNMPAGPVFDGSF
jgi:hypothetical protein